jgi:hypothetical protein
MSSFIWIEYRLLVHCSSLIYFGPISAAVAVDVAEYHGAKLLAEEEQ